MVEHPRGDRAVEDPVARTAAPGRRRRCASTPRASRRARPSAPTGRPRRPRASSSAPIRSASSPRPAADLEHPPRLGLGDRLERDLPRVGAGRRRCCAAIRAARPRLVRVLARGRARGSFERAHGSTIGCPGSRLPAALPPSQAFTVAPTSANSPSWIRPAAFLPVRVGEQQRVLARVVGRRRRRVAAVVGGDDQQVAGPKRLEQVGQPAVEVLQAAVEVDRVVPVAPEHVRLDEVDEDEPLVERLEQLLGLLDPLDVRLRRVALVDVLAGEDVADLADAVHGDAGLADERQVVRACAARARSRAGSACARSCPARR